MLLSCACSTPAARNDAFAVANGLTRHIVVGTDFSHLVYVREKPLDAVNETPVSRDWHIYIEGDGRPWVQRHVVAKDPTPTDPLMLQLMMLDSRPAIYLGRPCYHGRGSDQACNPWVWTYGRYSESVVESMRVALLKLVNQHRIHSLVLLGHSGGGTLAMLLAERLPQVRAVVTLAGNLDIDAWTAKHGYSVLQGSLNPAKRPALPGQIYQQHYIGKNDINITPYMLEAALKQQNGAQLFVLDNVGHRAGWHQEFLQILKTMESLGGDDD